MWAQVFSTRVPLWLCRVGDGYELRALIFSSKTPLLGPGCRVRPDRHALRSLWRQRQQQQQRCRGKSGACRPAGPAGPDHTEPRTLDPARSNLSVENSVNKSLFEGLFTYDENLKLVPNLATELPTGDNGGISANGLTYTVKIPDNARWSDGTALTANDFVYSLKRALDPKLAGP